MVLVATVLWGFIGVPVRVLSDAGLDSLQINGARTLITTVMLAAILYCYDCWPDLLWRLCFNQSRSGR